MVPRVIDALSKPVYVAAIRNAYMESFHPGRVACVGALPEPLKTLSTESFIEDQQSRQEVIIICMCVVCVMLTLSECVVCVFGCCI